MLSHRTLFYLYTLLTSVLFISDSIATEPAIRFGSVAMDTPRAMHQRLLPLTRYLSEELNQPVTLELAPDMPAAINDVAYGQVELAYLTPVAYLTSHEISDTQLVAKTITQGHDSFRLMIVVRDDSPIREINNLIGKRFAFGDPAALLQRAVVVGAGLNLDELKEFAFLDHYDNIVRGVLHGDYDAGIVKDTMAYKWQDKGIRIIYSSAELPPYNITASPNVDAALLKRIQTAFLKLDTTDPVHDAIIKALDPTYSGFAATSDAEYDVVRKLITPFKTTE